MRHCENESVEVYESVSEDLATALREAADKVDALEGLFRVATEPQVDPDTGRFTYLVTLYAHG